MVTTRMSLYRLADKVRNEGFLDGQLQVAGGNQARVLERLEKNKNDSKRQQLTLKIVYGVLLGFVPVLPLYTYIQVTSLLSGGVVPVAALTFISVLLLVVYFGMVTMYLLVLGVQTVSGFMSGDAFEWLEILPIPQKKLHTVGFIVLWRAFDVPIVVVVVVFPVLMAIASGSAIVFFTCLGVSILNAFFLFCVIVLIAEKFNRILKGGETNSRKASAARILAMLGAVVAMTCTGLVMNVVFQAIGSIFSSIAGMANPDAVNVLFGLIPFPFAPSFLVAIATLPPGSTPAPLLASSLAGTAILVILAWLLYRRVLAKMRNITSCKGRVAQAVTSTPAGPVVVRDIQPVSPVTAYVRKDIAALTRDFQGAMYLFMPLVYPFVIFLPAAQGMRVITGIDLYVYTMIFLAMLVVMTSGMLVSGLLGMEDSGASIVASLPIIPRDQATAKLRIICTVQLASSGLPMVLALWMPEIVPLVPFLLSYCLLSLAIVLLMFAVKVRLFGKMRYKYVLEEANVERKALKWGAVLGLGGGIAGGLLLAAKLGGVAMGASGITTMIAIVGGAGVGFALAWLNRMFPTSRPLEKP